MKAFIKRIEWFAVSAVLFLIGAIILAIQQPPTLDTLEFIVAAGFASVVSAILSVRLVLIELHTVDTEE